MEYSTKEVCAMLGEKFSTVSLWALKNGVKRKLKKAIMAYTWTEEDIRRFKARPKRQPLPKGQKELEQKAKNALIKGTVSTEDVMRALSKCKITVEELNQN